MDLESWLKTAQAGDSLIYAKCTNLGDSSVTAEERATPEQAKRQYSLGTVELCQRLRKDSEGKRQGFDYLCVKRKGRDRPLVHGSPWKMKFFGQSRDYYD
jgi:hypothetical protein